MRILIGLTYFTPHKSGLTIYAQRQAQALAARGHDVTVLTSQYATGLANYEFVQGVKIIRIPVAFHLSKGVLMPQMPVKAWKLIGESDILHLHLPQGDAAILAFIAKLRGKPVIVTYHCDLKMPGGWFNKLAGWGAAIANHISAALADVVVHNTRDFAEHSRFLKRYINKLQVVQPPIIVELVSKADVMCFLEKLDIDPSRPIIGMVSRLASEKGIEYLVEAMHEILSWNHETLVLFVGDTENVIGECAYRRKLLPLIEDLGENWKFLGILSEVEKAAFFEICDVLILPSINSTESFGMVQVEAMTCGTPVVATDLPGVRQPVLSTGMGKIVPSKDAHALAQGIIALLDSHTPVDFTAITRLREYYSPETVAQIFESIYQNLVRVYG